ncbi:hypothetical protein NKJ70_18970 [Mesorhizobium sp. M0092]|uniref:hypothetical protein n=1 Tax=unclassified Mesorhizobium TaxID=325217 RepID=UPI0012EC0C62|nr:hypothetical protein [Mesorhizobium sp. LSHC420B00]
MTTSNKADHQSVSEAFRKLIRSEGYRHHVQTFLNLEVEPELPPTLQSLLAAIDQAKQGSTEEVPSRLAERQVQRV